MQREKLISEIEDAIQARLDSIAEAGAETWDCYLPHKAANTMARAAVAIIEAYEESEQFAESEGRSQVGA